MTEVWPVGIILGGKAYTLLFDYPGCYFYPKGPWYDTPEMVVNLKERVIMRYKGPRRSTPGKLTKPEFELFRRARPLTHLAENAKELKRLKEANLAQNKSIRR